MSKRDFIIIMIRLFGLYSVVITVFTFVPQSSQWLWFYGVEGGMALLVAVLSISMALGLLWLLLRKAPWLVSALKLDSGMDDAPMDMGHIRPADILALGTFVVGGLLFVDSVPRFLSSSYFAFTSSLQGFDFTAQERVNWVIEGLDVIVGYLLVAHHQRIASKLFKQ